MSDPFTDGMTRDEAMTSMSEDLAIIGERLAALQRENAALRKVMDEDYARLPRANR